MHNTAPAAFKEPRPLLKDYNISHNLIFLQLASLFHEQCPLVRLFVGMCGAMLAGHYKGCRHVESHALLSTLTRFDAAQQLLAAY